MLGSPDALLQGGRLRHAPSYESRTSFSEVRAQHGAATECEKGWNRDIATHASQGSSLRRFGAFNVQLHFEAWSQGIKDPIWKWLIDEERLSGKRFAQQPMAKSD
jgi:hypothetical protein